MMRAWPVSRQAVAGALLGAGVGVAALFGAIAHGTERDLVSVARQHARCNTFAAALLLPPLMMFVMSRVCATATANRMLHFAQWLNVTCCALWAVARLFQSKFQDIDWAFEWDAISTGWRTDALFISLWLAIIAVDRHELLAPEGVWSSPVFRVGQWAAMVAALVWADWRMWSPGIIGWFARDDVCFVDGLWSVPQPLAALASYSVVVAYFTLLLAFPARLRHLADDGYLDGLPSVEVTSAVLIQLVGMAAMLNVSIPLILVSAVFGAHIKHIRPGYVGATDINIDESTGAQASIHTDLG